MVKFEKVSLETSVNCCQGREALNCFFFFAVIEKELFCRSLNQINVVDFSCRDGVKVADKLVQ